MIPEVLGILRYKILIFMHWQNNSTVSQWMFQNLIFSSNLPYSGISVIITAWQLSVITRVLAILPIINLSMTFWFQLENKTNNKSKGNSRLQRGKSLLVNYLHNYVKYCSDFALLTLLERSSFKSTEKAHSLGINIHF